ncbi:MAG TPA: hypothetical protein PLT66_07995, partial [Bacillota bacterium]|nr:hypothetical protein [Bacillota bacterium]
NNKPHYYSYMVITLLACSVVWIIATISFVYGTFLLKPHSWQSFIYAVPITCIVLLVFNTLWGNRRRNFLILSIFTWTLLSAAFLCVLIRSEFQYAIWVVFVLGIPIQVSIILWSQLKKRTIKKFIPKKNNDNKDPKDNK